jgi:hypothetical protein
MKQWIEKLLCVLGLHDINDADICRREGCDYRNDSYY